MTFINEYNKICEPIEEYIKLLQKKISKLHQNTSEIDTDR